MAITVAVLDRIGEDGDLAANLDMLQAVVADAAGHGASLLLTGECFRTGYDLTAEQARANALPASSPVWRAIADAAHDIHVGVGAPTRTGDTLCALGVIVPRQRFSAPDDRTLQRIRRTSRASVPPWLRSTTSSPASGNTSQRAPTIRRAMSA